MKEWTLTEQVAELWMKCQDLMTEIAGEGEPNRLDKHQIDLAASLATVLYLFVRSQGDVKDFVKTAKILIATVSTWVTTEVKPDRADLLGTVEINFVPKEPPMTAAPDGAETNSGEAESGDGPKK